MFQYVVLFSAFFIAVCAAWFSVSGISQLFVGAPISAMVMAIALELGKLVVVSFVYRHWKEVNKLLRLYMFSGAILLSIITSAGIYGYLSAAYSSAASEFTSKQTEVQVLNLRQESINQILQDNSRRIVELQSYRNQQEKRLDSLVGKRGLVTQQLIVRDAEADIRKLVQENNSLTKERDSLKVVAAQKMTMVLSENTKIGTFWYVANTLGQPLDRIVKWFVLCIVVVFDPLAVALVIAYNFLVHRNNSAEEQWISPKISLTKPLEKKEEFKKEEDGPYYTKPDYDWDHDDRWRTDEAAKIYKSRGERIRQ